MTNRTASSVLKPEQAAVALAPHAGIISGAGDDTYHVPGDVVEETPDEGTDLVISTISYTLGDNVENLTLDGSDSINGIGNGLHNVLTGNGAYNTLEGREGNDTLTGGEGRDTLIGATGDDVYYVDTQYDNVVESRGEGTDTIYASSNYSLSARYVEFLILTGSADLRANGNSYAQSLVGNSGDNWIEGRGGADTMMGGAGDDSFVVDGDDDLIVELAGEGIDMIWSDRSYSLEGVAGVEALILNRSNLVGRGNTLDNKLIASAGQSTLYGGAGNDTYYVNTRNLGPKDVVVELGGEGIDTIVSQASLTLVDHVENLTLTFTASNGIGNGLDNILTANRYGSSLSGMGGNDRLNGLEASDYLVGGSGADTMTGGLGGDSYLIDSLDDRIYEAHHEGVDTLITTLSYSLFGVAIDNVEMLGADDISLVGNSLNNKINGNSGDNRIDGAVGRDTMFGRAGDDTYYVDNVHDDVDEYHGYGTDTVFSSVTYSFFGRAAEILVLTGAGHMNGTGNSLANTITGNSGNNRLDGAGGSDVLTGGDGADMFQFLTGSGADTITDFSAAQNDSIRVKAYTKGAANEDLVAQVGSDVVITFDSANTVTVLNAVRADVLAHMVW